MYRTINVHVGKPSWPGVGKIPDFPAAFTAGTHNFNLNINSMLLIIGYLTTSTSVTGASLAEFWTQVKYLVAITPRDRDLRLARDYADLDAYRRAILSDGLGMGVPMIQLMKNLPLVDTVDGRYFLRRYDTSHDAHQHRTVKRGSNKTPDSVVQGHDGKWHTLECKGAQSDEVFRDRQIGSGTSQKLPIMFPPGYTEQRLVSGLSIGTEDGNPGHLKITDPVPEDPVIITESELEFAKDVVTRGVMVKLLRSTGFETAAEAVAAPFGKPQTMPPPAKKAGRNHVEFLVDRDQRTQEELLESTSKCRPFSGRCQGREVTLQLSRSIYIHDDMTSKVTVGQDMNVDIIDLLREQPTIKTLIDPSRNHWVDIMGTSIIQNDERTATLQTGNVFRSELILK